VLWRQYGAERAVDYLDYADVLEIDGVAARLGRPSNVAANEIAWLDVELQNAWDCPTEIRMDFSVSGKGRVVLESANRHELQSGAAGMLGIPVAFRDPGRVIISVVLRARPQDWFPRCLRLRPKPVFPVGPVWIMTILAAVTGYERTYGRAGIEVLVGPASRGSLPPNPGAQWVARVQ
jgi:hypothetical protein